MHADSFELHSYVQFFWWCYNFTCTFPFKFNNYHQARFVKRHRLALYVGTPVCIPLPQFHSSMVYFTRMCFFFFLAAVHCQKVSISDLHTNCLIENGNIVWAQVKICKNEGTLLRLPLP